MVFMVNRFLYLRDRSLEGSKKSLGSMTVLSNHPLRQKT